MKLWTKKTQATVQKTLTSQSHMAPTHLEKLILELLSMQRSVFVGVLWPASVGPSTVLAVSASSSVEAQTRSLQIVMRLFRYQENWEQDIFKIHY
ncbi:hypothetical protein H5410_019609 [Solanum commersonii]|uniref:Uncharacterized protein n=1 Tax=Solanum commersonii TaxID=4109 RepID=A0A9J5Z8T2_SOLCO|nr:hypothetical protein H5410_019609 [Solanum commersonii]